MALVQEWSQGYRKILLLKAALELGIFEALRNGADADEVAKKIGGDRKITGIMLECLAREGLAAKKENKYVNSEIAQTHLCKNSSLPMLNFLKKHFYDLEIWLNLAEIAKKGTVEVKRERIFPELVIHAMAEHAMMGELRWAVETVAQYEEFRRARKMLDLGGGHGLYSVAFTQLNPNLEAVVFDLPEVVERAKRYCKSSERVRFMAGDFFKDEIGGGYDFIFSSCNPAGKNSAMFPKICNALNSGGIYANKQFFWDDCSLDLLDLEWNLWNFGIEKGEKRFTFKGDLSLDEYLKELEKCRFEVLGIHSYGEQKMIVARKTK